MLEVLFQTTKVWIVNSTKQWAEYRYPTLDKLWISKLEAKETEFKVLLTQLNPVVFNTLELCNSLETNNQAIISIAMLIPMTSNSLMLTLFQPSVLETQSDKTCKLQWRRSPTETPEVETWWAISAWTTVKDQLQVFQHTPAMVSLTPLVPTAPIQTCHTPCKTIRPHQRNLSEFDPNKSTILWKWTFRMQLNQPKICRIRTKVSFKQLYFYNYFYYRDTKVTLRVKKESCCFCKQTNELTTWQHA